MEFIVLSLQMVARFLHHYVAASNWLVSKLQPSRGTFYQTWQGGGRLMPFLFYTSDVMLVGGFFRDGKNVYVKFNPTLFDLTWEKSRGCIM